MLLVLAYGNTLRRDDGFGPAVASYLQNKVGANKNLEIISEQQLLPEHAQKVAQASLVIFVDACSETQAGHIECRELSLATDKTDLGNRPLFPHVLSASTLLDLTQSLYGYNPQAYLYTVGADSLELSDTLSPLVESAVQKAAELILNRLIMAEQNQQKGPH